MKSLKTILILLLVLPIALTAQNKRKPTKTFIGKIKPFGEERLYVKPGEFKIDFEKKVYDENIYKRNNKYFVIVRDNYGDVIRVRMNNHEINLSKTEYPAEILRAGFTIPDFVYIDKRDAPAADNAKYRSCLHVSGRVYGPYEEFRDIFPNGYICKNKGVYTFMEFDGSFEEILPKHKSKEMLEDMGSNNVSFGTKTFEIVDDREYKRDYIKCKLNNEMVQFETRNQVVYRATHSEHYFILYNDSLMDNTLLIVDDLAYELDGVVKDIEFRFSQDASHWMAFTPNNLMVDGVTVNRTATDVKFMAIKNNGDYAYVVEGEGLGDKLYYGEELYLKGINMMWLAVDDAERFNSIFRNSHGYFYGIDHVVVDRTDKNNKYFYPTLFDGDQVFTVKSKDGKHSFVYCYNWPYVIIDGVRLDFPAVPHYAIFDEEEGCFYWNTVEDLSLYLYKYRARRK